MIRANCPLLPVLTSLEADLGAVHESLLDLVHHQSDEATARRLIGIVNLLARMRKEAAKPLGQLTDHPADGCGPSRDHVRRILIIDDDANLGRSLSRTIGRLHEVTVETQARLGLERLLRGERFDYILCDLLLPVMTGMEFFERVARELPDVASTVIFMTAAVSHPRVIHFLETNANPLLVKPFTSEALESLVS